ncbi:hypothetical protein Tsubulata_044840 [Turnera subulata]|uniref:Methyltransferase domain-containing protein n=1 Tax=Turnera subulata TaxID=218843 RepID=A0A9Q0FIA9_9ROSI|nr:hypothetical protein Tsubulata_044840 [Turnera subulata]
MGTATTQAYGEAWYWDKRYAKETGPFDWYQKYSSLAPLINLYVPPLPHHRVLVVGCGNSAFSQGMVEDGYQDVVNVDISSVVIDAMNKKYASRPQLKYIKMDVRDMSDFQTGSFDAVIDKGTPISTSYVCLEPLIPSCVEIIRAKMLLRCLRRFGGRHLLTNYRVLKDKGVYILVTYGAPVHRLQLLKDSSPWDIKLHVIDKLLSEGDSEKPKRELTVPVPLDANGSSLEEALGINPDVHYIYVCTKDEPNAKHDVAVQ